MKRVVTAVVLIPLVLLAVFRAPVWLFALFVLVVAILATLEYLHIAEHTGMVPFRRMTLVMVAGLTLFGSVRPIIVDQVRLLADQGRPLGRIFSIEHPYLWRAYEVGRIGTWLVLAIPLVLLVRGMRRNNLSTSLPGAAVSSFSLAYIAFPLLSLVFLRAVPAGALLMLYLFLVVWVGDIFAYYVGSAIGRHKLAPRISPGKSWEGAVASAISAALIGTVVLSNVYQLQDFLELYGVLGRTTFRLQSPVWWHALLLSLSLNIAAQLGDLVESMLKRGAGLKDSGTLLPGHGGMLDRIDALLFAAPVLLAYYGFLRLIPF